MSCSPILMQMAKDDADFRMAEARRSRSFRSFKRSKTATSRPGEASRILREIEAASATTQPAPI